MNRVVFDGSETVKNNRDTEGDISEVEHCFAQGSCAGVFVCVCKCRRCSVKIS